MSDYVIVRSYGAGVFEGKLVSQQERTVVLEDARRLWYWKGAASLSELSQRGVKYPDQCKFPMRVPSMTVFEVVEILPVSVEAHASIEQVPEWTA